MECVSLDWVAAHEVQPLDQLLNLNTDIQAQKNQFWIWFPAGIWQCIIEVYTNIYEKACIEMSSMYKMHEVQCSGRWTPVVTKLYLMDQLHFKLITQNALFSYVTKNLEEVLTVINHMELGLYMRRDVKPI